MKIRHLIRIGNWKIGISRGFSLVEIVIVIGITALVFMGVFQFGQSIFSFNNNAQKNLAAQSSARRVLKIIVKELRSTSPSSLGAYPISQTGTSSITFFSNIDIDPLKEQVRYFISGNDLRRGVTKPSGSPLVYDLGNEQIVTLINDVRNATNTPIFEYFDSTYSGTSTPLTQPVSPTTVRFVRITINIDKDINRPAPFQVDTQVFLRNLKDNL